MEITGRVDKLEKRKKLAIVHTVCSQGTRLRMSLCDRMRSVNAHFAINVSVQESGLLLKSDNFLYIKKKV